MKPNEGIEFVPKVTANEIGKARQVLGNVASNVNVITSSEVEKRMTKFEAWLSSNFQNREPADFSPR